MELWNIIGIRDNLMDFRGIQLGFSEIHWTLLESRWTLEEFSGILSQSNESWRPPPQADMSWNIDIP